MYETLVAINPFGMKFHLKQFMKAELKIHAWIVRLNNWIKVFLRFKLCVIISKHLYLDNIRFVL